MDPTTAPIGSFNVEAKAYYYISTEAANVYSPPIPFTITIVAPNYAPDITAGCVSRTITGSGQSTIAFTDANSADTHSILLTMADSSALPSWIAISGLEVEWTPVGVATPGAYELRVTIEDNGSPPLTDFCAFTLTYVN